MAGGLAELVPDASRPGSWFLYLAGTPQSQVDLDDPAYVEFEYIRRIAHLVDLAAPAGEPLRVLHLGGGALTLPRYVAATRPGSSQLVAESDAALMDLVREHLPLGPLGPRGARAPQGPSGPQGPQGPRGPRGRLRVRIGDAREVLESVRPASFDMVISDVFAGPQTPAHLTTVECARAAARALRPGGSYAVNVADGPPLAYAKEQVSTIAAVFPSRCLIAEPAVLRRRRFGNLVLAGSGREFRTGELRRRVAADPFPARLVCGADLTRFAAGARPAADATARPSPLPPRETFDPAADPAADAAGPAIPASPAAGPASPEASPSSPVSPSSPASPAKPA